jgi:hypothetical protein
MGHHQAEVSISLCFRFAEQAALNSISTAASCDTVILLGDCVRDLAMRSGSNMNSLWTSGTETIH